MPKFKNKDVTPVRCMKITIAPEILENYPGTHIGWLYACVVVEEKNDYVEALKKNLPRIVQEHGLFKTEELSKHPRIANWRKIYSDMGVKPSSYRCSLEALLRRVIKGESLRNVSSVVDCYNCVSVMTLLPMGAYDAYKLKGGLTLRYGKEGEIFLPLGSGEEITVKDIHILYADEEKICCWLWNHRDSRLCAVTTDTKRRTFSSFFVDAADESGAPDVEKALDLFAGHLEAIGCKVHLTSIPL